MPDDVQNFHEDVIQASHDRPVVVDFWAPWCGPCRVIGPVLEKLDNEAGSDWTLVKVNTDENQNLAVQYGIRGIPAVKMFWQGEVVNEFTGALPEHAIRKWLDESLPTASSELRSAIEQAIEAGNEHEARRLLQTANAENPTDAFFAIQLAKRVVFDDTEKAEALTNNLDVSDPDLTQLKESIEVIRELKSTAANVSSLPESPARESYLSALKNLVENDLDSAVTAFIDVVMKDRYYDDDRARKACVAIFTLLGPAHSVTQKHRRIFDMALY